MSGVNPKKQIESFNKLGAFTIPVIAVVSWVTGLSYCAYIGGGWDDIEYGDFATHPTLMLTAFLLVGSMSVSSHKLCELFGISYDKAKWIYVSLNTLIMLFAWLGWNVIYQLHESKHSHYKSSHSRIGIMTMGLWCIFYVLGLYIYFCAPQDKVAWYLEHHRVSGVALIILGLWTAALGVIYEEYTFDSDREAYERARSGVVLGGMMLIIFLIVGMLYYSRTLLPK